ncbi:MAG: DUF2892 domain-containing protein [Acidobacteria bacterium]|nr:DUF2892 domain-containing protein [Acidobacteriota bacterium]
MGLAESFGKSGFAQLVNSPIGRITRIAIGLGLIAWGYTHSATSTGAVIMAVGLVPLAAGVFDLCLISALLGGPLSGARIGKSAPHS